MTCYVGMGASPQAGTANEVNSILGHWGSNNLKWSNNYPHPNSTWLKSREVIARDLGHVSAEMWARRLRQNVWKLYQLPALAPVAVIDSSGIIEVWRAP